jgi:hypothetical protein
MRRAGEAEGDFGDGSDVGETPFFIGGGGEASGFESGDGQLSQALQPGMIRERRFLLKAAEVVHVGRGFFCELRHTNSKASGRGSAGIAGYACCFTSFSTQS